MLSGVDVAGPSVHTIFALRTIVHPTRASLERSNYSPVFIQAAQMNADTTARRRR
jgi:hypothetical protein